GEDGIRITCESMAGTDYPDDRKLLFLVCDGIITGSGNEKSTPDICVNLMEIEQGFEDPNPQSYIAIAAGNKQHNMAKVYAGYFPYENHRVPMIVVVKCGNPDEQNSPKPGNRGKRDSQLILMSFFSRVTYNDRMCALDYDLFGKIHHLMGVTPDFFELVLMVDADTKVYSDSLRLLVNCMCNDQLIMGLCGETKIGNKRDSWVTAIQVFEYYISHHLGKGFESVFGGYFTELKLTYNDRMCALDYDLFGKIHHLMGVTPDFFELVLMVDADTKVYSDSLRLLVNCMCNDQLIMGLCGETKIGNKRDSWVTAIQVFEYYISHHLGKGFESVFGGVTCLPGCFCMYRFKARKGDNDWVPIIANPEIVQEYSQNEVNTLHQKNLLLLGEDRFLTTLMLRHFPNRKMTFCPQAICKTIVPDEFKVLLSQRRRWINSTIHNLMELVLVRNLCGTFCFSMQFVVFMELQGTIVLPVAIMLTFTLIISSILNPPHDFAESIPLLMLAAILGLPAILILITTRKLVYIAWMLIYLLALPIWNFVLPTYAYWHFDDFSWGETRKVEGESKGDDHGKKEGQFDRSKVPLKRWEDWERTRIRRIKRKERQRQQLESGSIHLTHLSMASEEDVSLIPPNSSHYDDDETSSIKSGATHDLVDEEIALIFSKYFSF
ncbi:14449_t:CDS:2, partial [Entrophospora sp. SA101]